MSFENRILVASDHAGVKLKAQLKSLLPEWEWVDLGPADETRVDYPDSAQALCNLIVPREAYSQERVKNSQQAPQGILICGSGIGMSIAANKIDGIRAALVDNASAARLSREHNNANILCLGSRFLAAEYAAEIVKVWLTTPFSEDPRHIQRVEKLHSLEKK